MFRIIIRGRNCHLYIRKCLESLVLQTCPDWKAYVLLDAPKEIKKEMLVIWDFIDRLPQKISEKIIVDAGKKHLGLCKNLWNGIELMRFAKIKDEDIVAILDADDYLCSKKSLEIVAYKYEKNPTILLTYGSYIKATKGRTTRISQPYPSDARVRRSPWRGSHLKTVKWKLLKHLRKDAFLNEDGNWLEAASDVAMMLPLMEMAGMDRCKHISAPIYYWRNNAKHHTKVAIQRRCNKIIRAKKPFERINL